MHSCTDVAVSRAVLLHTATLHPTSEADPALPRESRLSYPPVIGLRRPSSKALRGCMHTWRVDADVPLPGRLLAALAVAPRPSSTTELPPRGRAGDNTGVREAT